MIQLAETDDDVRACHPVMVELRPHLAAVDEFVAQVKRQRAESGYRLVMLRDPDAGVVAVAGIRIAEWLPSGRCLEIEDLVTRDGERSRGHGGVLFDWIVEHARREGCAELKLVSHVSRFAAHKFYLNKGMVILAHFFSMPL
jgi:GNAT superfamily N-acetyltransferase